MDMRINDNAREIILHDLGVRIKKETESIAFTEERLARKNEDIEKAKAELAKMMAERDDLEKEIEISRGNIADLGQAAEALEKDIEDKEKKNEDQNGVRE